MTPAHPDEIGPTEGNSYGYTARSVWEQPKECDKELKASPWPENAPDPNLTELRGTWLKNEVCVEQFLGGFMSQGTST